MAGAGDWAPARDDVPAVIAANTIKAILSLLPNVTCLPEFQFDRTFLDGHEPRTATEYKEYRILYRQHSAERFNNAGYFRDRAG